MATNRSAIWRVLAFATAVGLAACLLLSECASGGGMGAAYKICDCLGVEWQLYDRRPADGPRRTICLGIIRSTTCYRLETGPPVHCETRPR